MIKETIVLEDDIEYIITDTIKDYVYLNNINDLEDFCIRKKIKENDEFYLIGLENDKEFYNALKLFEQKYK
jgi:hypothetical protein